MNSVKVAAPFNSCEETYKSIKSTQMYEEIQADAPSGGILQYAPFESFVEANFFYKLDEIKLEIDRLSDAPKPIFGYYTHQDAKTCLLQVDYSAFNKEFKAPKHCHTAHGTLYNKNTIEDFKKCDKQALLTAEGKKLLDDFKTGRILNDPSLLIRFFVLSYADIKSHTFYYWFAFPCPITPTLEVVMPGFTLSSSSECQLFIETLRNSSADLPPFFVLNTTAPGNILSLQTALNATDFEANDLYFCFVDPSEFPQPAWVMRTYVCYVYFKCPQLIGQTLNFMGVRCISQHFDKSIVWKVRQSEPCNFSDEINLKYVGWERNRNGRMGPRVVDLQQYMDPALLAENSVNLNLKLMKWRLVPDLNLAAMSSTKCLLFGAGTLGCAVARNLLSWGFKQVTLLDNGRVGYSNPIRQNLYRYEDAKSGNVMKATIAAARLKEINPSISTAGYVMQIPMPGHTVGDSLLEQTSEHLNLIDELVKTHDAIFLLTDSRESRWLPTLLGAVYNKIVINAALGFDSYLVMRHGCAVDADAVGNAENQLKIDGLKCINGYDLGCYFCNDVTAPGNSQSDRTLDQQCTVTRPGVSNIASSYAVELLVSLLQHPLVHMAPAYYCSSNVDANSTNIPEGKLGIIPHSIRGNLHSFQNILPATRKFEQCIACSQKIIAEYRENGKSFLFKVFETAKYLEDVTGISEFKRLDSTVIDYSDLELEMSDESE